MSCDSRVSGLGLMPMQPALIGTCGLQEPSAWELGLWLAVGALDTSRKHPKVAS